LRDDWCVSESPAVTEFREFVQEVSAAAIFAMTSMLFQSIELTKGLQSSIAVGNENPTMFFGAGSPNEQFAPFVSRPLRELIQKASKGGSYIDLIGHGWIVTLFSSWEEEFRGLIAASLGLAPDDLKCDLFGDLRHMRNDIAHHRGVATVRNTGHCRVLRWASTGQLISAGPVQIEEFLVQLAPHLALWANGATDDG
jgi:hypothetical protein